MAITIDNAREQYGKQNTWRLLSIALAACLAVAGLIGGSLALDLGGSDATTVSRGTTILSLGSTPDPKVVTFYLVDSQAQVEYIAWADGQAQNERDAASVIEPSAETRVLMATTPAEADAAFAQIGKEMLVTQDGDRQVEYRVIDMRGK
jgi:hypothetical protein